MASVPFDHCGAGGTIAVPVSPAPDKKEIQFTAEYNSDEKKVDKVNTPTKLTA